MPGAEAVSLFLVQWVVCLCAGAARFGSMLAAPGLDHSKKRSPTLTLTLPTPVSGASIDGIPKAPLSLSSLSFPLFFAHGFQCRHPALCWSRLGKVFLSLGCYPCLATLPFGVASPFLPVFPMTTPHCSPPGPGRICPADGRVVNGHHGPFTITITPSSLPICSSLAGSRHTAVAPAVVGWMLPSMFPLPVGEWPVLHSGLLGGEARAL